MLWTSVIACFGFRQLDALKLKYSLKLNHLNMEGAVLKRIIYRRGGQMNTTTFCTKCVDIFGYKKYFENIIRRTADVRLQKKVSLENEQRYRNLFDWLLDWKFLMIKAALDYPKQGYKNRLDGDLTID